MTFLKRSTLAISLAIAVNSTTALATQSIHNESSSNQSTFTQVIPTESLFLKGNPLIQAFTSEDRGVRGTGLRLLPSGIYHTSKGELRTVWTVQNSNDEATPVILSNPETEWSIAYTIPAHSVATFASPATTTSLEHHLYLPRPAKGNQPARHKQIDTQLASDEIFTLPTFISEQPEVYQRGLAAWRKKDQLFGGASCSSCHAPDGFDLAYFNFDRDTILRRTAPHLLDVADQEAIADLIEYLRETYHIDQPKDPLEFRPFQPGGKLVAGETRLEKDLAFGQYFKDQGYRFASEPVLSKEEALRQRDEWLAMDIRQIPIGIALPRWSEDGFHGEQHKSINDWIPLVPRFPKDHNEAHWFALQDTYLAEPTDENFLAYYDAINPEYFKANSKRSDFSFTHHPFQGNGKILGLSKFRSVQIASHLFRQEHLENGISFAERPPVVFDRIVQMKGKHERQAMNNPMWEVGDYFRKHDGKKADIEMPESPQGLLNTFLPIEQEANQARASWLTLGWLFDPALQKTGRPGSNMTINGAYLQKTFNSNRFFEQEENDIERVGYPIHSLYVFTHKVLGKNYADYVVACEPVCQTPEFSIISANFLSNHEAIKNLPKAQPELKEMYVAYTQNIIRMLGYLVQEQVENNGPISGEVRQRLRDAEQFIDHTKQQNPHYEHDKNLLQNLATQLL